jgi:hypothetical protein
MPLVTIEDLAPDDPSVIDAALAAVADAVSRALGRAPVEVWARFVTTGRTRFGADGTRHPIVTVATGEQPSHVRERVLRAAAAAVADAVGISADAVWARFDVLAPGTVLADGEMQ